MIIHGVVKDCSRLSPEPVEAVPQDEELPQVGLLEQIVTFIIEMLSGLFWGIVAIGVIAFICSVLTPFIFLFVLLIVAMWRIGTNVKR